MSEFHSANGVATVCMDPTGFSFDNVHRNALIERHLSKVKGQSVIPVAKKTGTTIVGMAYKDGIVLGADTRATAGTEVAEKNCEKIHYLADNIYCCGAGTAADTEKTTDLVSSQLELLRMNTKSQSRIVTANTILRRMLFRYQGQIGAALVLGGCDVNGPHIYQIYPNGCTAKLPFTTMGSGSLAAMSVFETEYRDDMTEEEAVTLVKRAILAGVFNDLGSGSNCDTCVIRMDGTTELTRGAVTPNDVGPLRSMINRGNRLIMPKGSTAVLSSKFVPSSTGVSLSDIVVTEMEA